MKHFVEYIAVPICMWLFVCQQCVCQDEDSSSPCEVTGIKGACVPLPACAQYNTLLKNSNTFLEGLRVTQERQCGFHGASSKVCCPTEEELPAVTDKPLFKGADEDFVEDFPGLQICGHAPIQSAAYAWNGQPVKDRAMAKWMALLGYKDAPVLWQCGGSIITPHHILTAAHCIKRNLYIVRVGELDFASESRSGEASPIDFLVKKTIPHEEYTKYHNDIAIVVLDGNIVFGKHTLHIGPVCLPINTNAYRKIYLKSTFITGWGETEKAGERPTHLLYAYLDILDRSHCADAYRGRNLTIDERVLCAGDPRNMRDACNGDSGGPLITKYMLEPRPVEDFYGDFYFQVGIISYGFRCSHQRFSGVYTNVAHFMPWIQEKVLGIAS